MGSYKRLTTEEWAVVERLALSGRTNTSLATEFGVSESVIRKRLGSIKNMKIEETAKHLVVAREELQKLPPAMQLRAIALADIWQDISQKMAESAVNGASTSQKLSMIAQHHADQIDLETPDPEKLKMVHALTETANKAAFQPLEILKANKEMIAEKTANEPAPTSIDASTLSSETRRELLSSRN